jgi:hypothetical protein
MDIPDDPVRAEAVSVAKAAVNRIIKSPLFCNAAVNKRAIMEIVRTTLKTEAVITYARLEPEFDSTILGITLRTLSPQVPTGYSIALEVLCNGTQADSHEAFVDHLASWTVPSIEGAVSHTPRPLGDVSLCTRTSVFWVHANLFLCLETTAPYFLPRDSTSKYDGELFKIAEALDAHIATGHTDHGGVRRGTVPLLAGEPPARISKGTSVDLLIETNPEFTDNFAVARVKDNGILMCCGPADDHGLMTFAAVGTNRTTVTLLRPHDETLMPGVREWQVEVI